MDRIENISYFYLTSNPDRRYLWLFIFVVYVLRKINRNRHSGILGFMCLSQYKVVQRNLDLRKILVTPKKRCLCRGGGGPKILKMCQFRHQWISYVIWRFYHKWWKENSNCSYFHMHLSENQIYSGKSIWKYKLLVFSNEISSFVFSFAIWHQSQQVEQQ